MDKHDIQRFVVEEPYLDISCSLGEAPFWDKATGTLRFLDVNNGEIHIVHPERGPSSHKVIKKLDYPIGHTADIENDTRRLVYGGKAGFGIFDKETGVYEYIVKFWANDSDAARKDHVMRANDGGVDSRGRYWLGVMNHPLIEAPGPVGTVFRLDPDLSLHKMIEGISIPNGVSWSKDEKTLFIADSSTHVISAYDYDIETGNISNKRPFFDARDIGGGEPDGEAIDDEDHMWSAVYGTGKVIRISPAGKVVAEIQLPTPYITCPAFVDDWLYVTSATEDPKGGPKLQGALFRCKVGVKGIPIHKFKPSTSLS
ncbi:putative anterior fat body protein [Microthyrium microscopicum]|uniref:Putative anterior fat body protein n=1 Tax=Microthyrium microscopicum TaxID=703497 RepID=A0A6A6U6L8_9PEZI|nr:putative anterior fat body protein [Microthyrium microscopicum]